MKYVKNTCWVMFLIWLSTIAIGGVLELYEAGGWTRISLCVLTFAFAVIYAVTVGRCLNMIGKANKGREV